MCVHTCGHAPAVAVISQLTARAKLYACVCVCFALSLLLFLSAYATGVSRPKA